MDHMGINVDNPMNILTQDTARQFLSNSSPEEKYRFFMTGVQLKQLDTDYRLIEESLICTREMLVKKQPHLNILKKKEHEAKLRLKRLESNQNSRDELAKLSNEVMWATVKEFREEDVSLKEHLQELQRKMTTSSSHRMDTKTSLEALQQKISTLDLELRQIDSGFSSRKLEIKILDSKIMALRDEMTKVMAEHRAANAAVSNAATKIADLEEDLVSEHKRLKSLDGGRQAQTIVEKERLEELIKTLTQEQSGCKHRIEELDKLEEAKEEELYTCQRLINEKSSKIKNEQDLIASISKGQKDQLARFGGLAMVELIRDINASRNFKSKPIGPWGSHMKILKKEWTGVIETVIGGNVNAFLVRDFRERDILQKMLSSKTWERSQCPPIIVAKGDAFDYSQGEPDQNFDTILRVMEFSNEDVKRQLVNLHNIESTVLIKDRGMADNTMHARPQNVSSCYALNPKREGRSAFRVGGKGGASGTQPIDYPSHLRLRDIDQAEIKLHELKIRELLEKVYVHNQDLQTIKGQIQDFMKERKQKERRINEIKIELRKNNAEIRQLNDALIDLAADSRVSILEEEIQLAKEELTQAEQGYSDLQTELDSFNPRLDHPTREKNDKTTEEEQNHVVRREKSDALVDVKKVNQQQLENLQWWTNKIEDYQRRMEQKKTEIDENRQELDRWLKTAREESGVNEIDTDRTVEQLSRLIEKQKAKIQELEKSVGEESVVTREFEEARAAHATARAEWNSMSRLVNTMTNSLKIRRARYKRFRSLITDRAKQLFLYYLLQRGFSGRLIIEHGDHGNGTLKLRVHTNEENKKADEKDPKSLSGGEKSFSTICLLLSLWEAMGCPIRCLDEFDVFMDAMNRSISMKLMIQAAEDSVQTQFILITPQGMGNLSITDNIKVSRMQDPDRGRT
ncbi:Structural maintenance of chromosomes protein 6 [Neolecta irregularis DAH-3]|uniref:Structural maintenance of chromosomes protein 6 n=1 Tax=Neolecta irregularis (strain DAH-3) TaxID=1198029 RepID=A0A1U7LHZ6_NEOID|nr:Structural maintenance of chromosomes protein 6 [Neolecta irregularis DAH-3]|eukprot:OLL22172.1 Structural maintenance of chromosomes protein 6 [Neolecta irregularis DAH-3]